MERLYIKRIFSVFDLDMSKNIPKVKMLKILYHIDNTL